MSFLSSVSKRSSFAAFACDSNLFEHGGCWFDIGDVTTLFSDLDGLRPAKVGESVAMVRDKSSHARSLTQENPNARPVLRQSGKWLYLDFDGVDDCLILNGELKNLGQGITIATGINLLSGGPIISGSGITLGLTTGKQQRWSTDLLFDDGDSATGRADKLSHASTGRSYCRVDLDDPSGWFSTRLDGETLIRFPRYSGDSWANNKTTVFGNGGFFCKGRLFFLSVIPLILESNDATRIEKHIATILKGADL